MSDCKPQRRATDSMNEKDELDAVCSAAYADQASATPSTTWTQVQAILPVAPWQ